MAKENFEAFIFLYIYDFQIYWQKLSFLTNSIMKMYRSFIIKLAAW